jgi:hypothetical protein
MATLACQISRYGPWFDFKNTNTNFGTYKLADNKNLEAKKKNILQKYIYLMSITHNKR